LAGASETRRAASACPSTRRLSFLFRRDGCDWKQWGWSLRRRSLAVNPYPGSLADGGGPHHLYEPRFRNCRV